MTAAHTPLTTPADRSISPSNRTKTRPIARMMIGTAWTSRFAMFRGVRKVSGRRTVNRRPRTDDAEDGRQRAEVTAADPVDVRPGGAAE